MSDTDDPFYRLYNHSMKGPIVVCVQWFDLYDYDEDRWINSVDYETEALALDALALHIVTTPLEDALDAALRMDLDAVEHQTLYRIALGLPFPISTSGNSLRLLFVRLRHAEALLAELDSDVRL